MNLILKEELAGMAKLKARNMGRGHTRVRFITTLQKAYKVSICICVTNLYELVIKYASCSRIEGEMREGYWFGKRTLYNHM